MGKASTKARATAAGCPCGSGRALSECCGRYLTGGPEPFGAPTPEALMRSRFTAFALGDEAYLLGTWAEETRPERIWVPGEEHLKWFSLKILEAPAPKPEPKRDATGKSIEEGRVRFIAKARSRSGVVVLAENSLFRRNAAGRWVYVSGELESEKPAHFD